MSYILIINLESYGEYEKMTDVFLQIENLVKENKADYIEILIGNDP